MEVQNHGNNKRKPSCVRDFPPNCGNLSSSSKTFSGMNSFHRYTRDFPPGYGSNFLKSTQIGSDKMLETRNDSGVGGSDDIKSKPPPPMGIGCSDGVAWRRNVAAVKSKPAPMGERVVMGNTQNLKVKENESVLRNSMEKRSFEREKVLEMVSLFRKRCKEISQSGRGIRRIDTTAYTELKTERKMMIRSAVMIGSVPGVEVGDKFHYRIELSIVGLHKHMERGIDSMEWGGSRIATCIVASERHLDKMNDPNALIYIGEGGVLRRGSFGVPPDQELKGGNVALLHSMEEKRPVRVVRGLTSESYGHKVLYVYDGLYEVKGCEKKKGVQGNRIFEFQMARCSGQPAVAWRECRQYKF